MVLLNFLVNPSDLFESCALVYLVFDLRTFVHLRNNISSQFGLIDEKIHHFD